MTIRDETKATLASDNFIASAMKRWHVSDRNRVKPGIGESTRALLRRVPERLILRDRTSADVEHLVALAETHEVPIEIDKALAPQGSRTYQNPGRLTRCAKRNLISVRHVCTRSGLRVAEVSRAVILRAC